MSRAGSQTHLRCRILRAVGFRHHRDYEDNALRLSLLANAAKLDDALTRLGRGQLL